MDSQLYWVQVNYQSHAGSPCTFSDLIRAQSFDEAIDKGMDIVKKRKNCMKIHGGEASVCETAKVEIPPPQTPKP
jgi:formylmethanofuran dehydrogenase subunit B